MAYSTSNPPMLVSKGIGGKGNRWRYESADAQTAVRVAGYFTNGWQLGIRAGDYLDGFVTGTNAGYTMICNASSKAGGVDFTDGAAIAATDSD